MLCEYAFAIDAFFLLLLLSFCFNFFRFFDHRSFHVARPQRAVNTIGYFCCFFYVVVIFLFFFLYGIFARVRALVHTVHAVFILTRLANSSIANVFHFIGFKQTDRLHSSCCDFDDGKRNSYRARSPA